MIEFKIYTAAIDLPKNEWNGLTRHDIFLQTHYLEAFEKACPNTICMYYVGVFNKNQLVGATTASLGWSWVGYETIYYNNIDVLKALISESVSLFKGNTIGYKMYSSIETRIDDLKQAGFHVVGIVPGTVRTGDVFYLDLEDLEYHSPHSYQVEVCDKEKELFEKAQIDLLKILKLNPNFERANEELRIINAIK